MRNSHIRNFRSSSRRAGLNVVPVAADGSAAIDPAFAPQRAAELNAGIEVQEEELEAVVAQRVFKMRCGCGRSWFELELKKFVTCPACRKLGLVTPDQHSGTA
jgi:hypothetical protein